jgi:death on curing protein
MDNVTYLTLEQVLVIHEDQIERYGGSSGVRDLSLLESAIFRPQTTFSGEDLYKTHFDKAAALMHSLIMNHAFIDGNKRTGTTAMLVYFKINSIIIYIDNNELVKTVLLIEKEKWGIEGIAEWLKNKSKN